ncbi:DUF411 domain-containing protein [Halomonas cerina]|uniref:Metal-binding protein n=1 Tax=Halomonas cerina TaxID=447424 RepID=A0A839V7D5_9GAMM|nr:DUF411 domain-containing protein [Halomonas cerina]MBB3191061.1 hypothetical protein [Halomonas cerina]
MKTRSPALLAAGLLLASASTQAAVPTTATLYKNPQCGCCDGYAEHLEARGIEVEIIENRELHIIKQEAGIPYGHGSCHTVMLGDYVIEGHVPFAAIETLFEERPDVDGLALAGMPQGTPGMPGPQQAPYEIMSFTAGQASLFMTL